MFEQKWAKIMQSSNAHQSSTKVFFLVLYGKEWYIKLLSRIFKIFVLQKKKIQKLTFWKLWFFLCFQKFSKTGIFVLDHYICSARAHQISGRYHFWFPFYNSKKMSVWWVNCTDPLRPRFWHYDVFYEFLRATIFRWSCREKLGLQNCHIGFSKFWFFKPKFWIFLLFTFWILFGFSKPD